MAKHNVAWLNDAIFYQLYPQSFYDSNGDGIGDIPGIIAKLDYIKSLGCNAVWINPWYVSPFQDAGYDVADYYKVAPRYGTNADAKRLFAAAKKKGLRIVLDLVPGHTSVEHPWFKESCRHQKNQYSDWYIWTNSIWNNGDGKLRTVSGYAERFGQYVTNFFYSQPALNFGFANPDSKHPWQQLPTAPGPKAVRDEIIKIMRFWLAMGASGFRVDMASSLIKNDDSKQSAMIRFWNEVRPVISREFPEAALISEWSNPVQSLSTGFDIDFLIHFGPSGPAFESLSRQDTDSFFHPAGKGDITTFMKYYLPVLRKTQGQGFISIPSGNHDVARLNNQNLSARDLEIAFAFLLTMPGVPFIYYGDEIGMRYIAKMPSKEGAYNRTGARTPMQWSSGRNAGFSTAPVQKIYLPIDPQTDRPNVAQQERADDSLLNCVRSLTQFRQANLALQAAADFQPLYYRKKAYPLIYLRRCQQQTLVIALNPSSKSVSAMVSARGLTDWQLKKGNGVTVRRTGRNWQLKLAPVSYSIFQVAPAV